MKKRMRTVGEEVGRLFRILRYLLLRAHTPHAIALGFGLGLFLSVVPVPFLGMFIALAVAVRFRLNGIATYLGTFVVNPVTGAVFYTLDYIVGRAMLEGRFYSFSEVMARLKGAESAFAFFREAAGTMLLGGLVVGVVIGGGSAVVLYGAFRVLKRTKRIMREGEGV